jgi:gentisate 1,2-dioxygenase
MKSKRAEFYEAIELENLAPLWEVMRSLVPKEPSTPCIATLWPWQLIRSRLIESGGLITADEAIRRVLVLENPGIRGTSAATHSLYAGIQLLLPGEIAPAHRHTATAVRLILEGHSGYTTVNSERVSMEPGDFIITPTWNFHDHGNLGSEPVIWLDCLDVPIVQLFDASFSEELEISEREKPVLFDDSEFRFSGSLMPIEYEFNETNPLLRYPYKKTRIALKHLAENSEPHQIDGFKLKFCHPATGSWPTSTIAAFMQLLPKGFIGRGRRSTDATIYCVVEGSGFAQVGALRIEWHSNDVFVVPSWVVVSLQASEESVLFSTSDRPAQQALGIWREKDLID